MRKKKIAFFDAKPYDIENFEEVNGKFGFNIKYFTSHLNIDTAPMAAGYDAVCAFVNDSIDSDVIKVLSEHNIKLISMRCAGYNNVDLEAAHGKMHVLRVPAYSPGAVAEHAVALMLSLNRKIHKAYNRTREANFSINGLLGFDMKGKTAGVVGTGRIGREIIRILRGFGMQIIAYDAFPDKEYAKETGFDYVTLKELYSRADIITLHCPLTEDTFHMINSRSIKEVKKGVMIINTGRGSLIDTKALIAGLKSGKIGFAGLDVYEEEDKYFFEDFSGKVMGDDILARLLTFNNVLVTSHQGFFTKEAVKNIAETTLNNVKDYFDGRPLVNEICYRCGGACRKSKNGRCF
jgi:D-lactate dehydrogenase